MDKTQFMTISAILADTSKSATETEDAIEAVLGIDLTDDVALKVLKEKLVGNDTVFIETAPNGNVTVSFGDSETVGATRGLAFIMNLMMVIQLRAIDKFLPEPKAEVATGGRSGGLGSPAIDRRPAAARGRAY